MTRRLTTVRLACDGCGATRQGRIGEKLDALRKALEVVGWRCSTVNDVDACPSCRVGVQIPIASDLWAVR